ncbi:hypothetical protein F8388_018194 [Cannabis sativa]|uniref:Uncharacterized protein n=1 Tax=Cannabis sativa TaxID=3483 RepID=A0A7J6GCZ2_CANSA|nr:hypothetical protein F8388_018194 [Cannabis sativa]
MEPRCCHTNHPTFIALQMEHDVYASHSSEVVPVVGPSASYNPVPEVHSNLWVSGNESNMNMHLKQFGC